MDGIGLVAEEPDVLPRSAAPPVIDQRCEAVTTMLGPTPYEIVTAVETVRNADKRSLIAVTRGLEHEASLDPPPLLLATFQDARFLTPRTRAIYARLAMKGTDVRLYARSLQACLAPGVRGFSLDDDDPVVDQWSLVMTCEQHAAVFVASDGVPGGGDGDTLYAWAMSRDPEVVRACAQALGAHEADGPETRSP